MVFGDRIRQNIDLQNMHFEVVNSLIQLSVIFTKKHRHFLAAKQLSIEIARKALNI